MLRVAQKPSSASELLQDEVKVREKADQEALSLEIFLRKASVPLVRWLGFGGMGRFKDLGSYLWGPLLPPAWLLVRHGGED